MSGRHGDGHELTGERRTGEAEPGAVSTIRAALDVLVVKPLELGAKFVDDGPGALAEARQELNNARFIGRMTVSRSVSELRDRIESSSAHQDDRRDAPVRGSGADAARAESDEPDVSELAFADYDRLRAIDIVAELASMSPDQRAVVERYERANRQRRTILGKLAQLAASRPA